MGAPLFLQIVVIAVVIIAVRKALASQNNTDIEKRLRTLEGRFELLKGQFRDHAEGKGGETEKEVRAGIPLDSAEMPVDLATYSSPTRFASALDSIADRIDVSEPSDQLSVSQPNQPILDETTKSSGDSIPESTPIQEQTIEKSVSSVGPSINWEAFIGIRGAAWAGGIALAIAGSLFAKYSIDNDLISPPLRIAILLAVGVGALVLSGVVRGRGHLTSSNSIAAAGIALLYTAFYAAYALYKLVPIAPSFAGFVMVTITASVMAVRNQSPFIAVLGLLGGFATPLILSTGEDREIGFFSYLFLLNVGMLWVASRLRNGMLAALCSVSTVLLQVIWFQKYMSPEKLGITLALFLAFALLFLFSSSRQPKEGGQGGRFASLAAGLAPMAFAIYIAGENEYLIDWPLLMGFTGVLCAGLLTICIYNPSGLLPQAGAVAAGLLVIRWASSGIPAEVAWPGALAPLVLGLLFGIAPRAGRWLGRTEEPGGPLESAALMMFGVVVVFGAVLISRSPSIQLWPFLLLLGGAVILLLERSGSQSIKGAYLMGSLVLALLVQAWFFMCTSEEAVFRNLTIPLLLASALTLAAYVKTGRKDDPVIEVDDPMSGGLLAAIISFCGILSCVAQPWAGRDPIPLFAASAAVQLLLVMIAIRREWTWIMPISLGLTGLMSLSWHVVYYTPEDSWIVLPGLALAIVAYLFLPFILATFVVPKWRERRAPWIASALAGPVFFFPLLDAVKRTWGNSVIGLLPLGLAALALAGLNGYRKTVRADDADPDKRMDCLTVYGAVVLGFITAAIPLQFDKNWITLGLFLEAAALWWLVRRIPHPGLPWAGLILFIVGGVRLLLNPHIFNYGVSDTLIFNWILYTYGVSALACFVGPRWLPADSSEISGLMSGMVNILGLVLVFALINLEIADWFANDGRMTLLWSRHYARDLATSVAWGLYGMLLLSIGIMKSSHVLRLVSLVVIILTVGKVFLYDLSNLEGLYRVLSFLGLAVALIVVSLSYRTFVFKKEN